MRISDLLAEWAGVGLNGAFDLHESTSPAAIAAAQRADVAEAVGRLRGVLGREPTAAEVGEDVMLAVWRVGEIMAALAEGSEAA